MTSITKQNPPTTKPCTLDQEKLRQLLNYARHKYRVPAISAAIIHSQSVILNEISGVKISGHSDKATLDDFFHIGSCAKSVLAVIAAYYIERGLITWQTPFFKVLPTLKKDSNPAYENICLEDLFRCRAGIQAYTNAEKESFPEFPQSNAKEKLCNFASYLFKQSPSSVRKGNSFKFLYSNASYMLASMMLEEVSGLSYEKMVQAVLQKQGGLKTAIGWPNRIDENQPWGHTLHKNRVESFPPSHSYQLPDLITPAGDLCMSSHDYAEYTRLHLSGLRGQGNCISPESYQYIHFAHSGFSIGVANGSLAGLKFSGFDGSAGTFFCRSVLVPEQDFAFTVMMNAGSGSANMPAVDWIAKKIGLQCLQLNWVQKLGLYFL